MRSFTRVALFATAAVMGASASQAATVYQSLDDLTVAPVSNAWCSSCGGSYRIYDTFDLAQAQTLSKVTFAVQSDYNYPTATTVSFNNVAGNAPGAEIASFTFNPADFAAAQQTAFNTTLISVNLPNLTLASGTYYISFYSPVNLGVPGYAKEGESLFQADSGTIQNQTAAFSLEASAAVPEPATWAMMIGGFGLAGAAMRRRVRTTTVFA